MPFKDPVKQKEYKKQHYINNKAAYKAAQKRNKNSNRPEKQKYVMDYKLDKGCERCGYDESPTALEFHHVDPTKKDSAISRLVSGNWSLKTIKKEIDKCVVLCANCHRTVHKEIEEGVVHDWVLDSTNDSDDDER